LMTTFGSAPTHPVTIETMIACFGT